MESRPDQIAPATDRVLRIDAIFLERKDELAA